MIRELFGMLSAADVTAPVMKSGKFDLNLNKNRIRSISAYSSNSIFYFPVIISDQCTLEEITMISRALEKQYASFVVACISLMPFHRIRADDRGSIEEYLAQFHQNLGMTSTKGNAFAAALTGINSLGENASITEDAQEFFYGVWKESVEKNTDYFKLMTENYIPLSEMFNKDAVDPYTKILQERYAKTEDELDTWGFIGNATDDMFDDDDDDDLDDSELDDSILGENSLTESGVGEAIDNIKFTLESVSENKILSCSKLTTLRSLESKLKTLKTKYTKYLNRYKKKYNENKKKGSDKGGNIAIRFNRLVITDPKTFMKRYGEFIKVINKRLKLCDKRRAEILKRRDDSKMTSLKEGVNVMTELTQMDFNAIDTITDYITECINAPDSKVFTSLNEALSPEQIAANQRAIDGARNRQNSKRSSGPNDSDRRTSSGRVIDNMDADMDVYYQSNYRDAHKNGRQQGHASDINPTMVKAPKANFKSFDREVFTDMDMKKSNDMIPTFTQANIGFIVDDTEDVVNRSVMIGIKTYIHKVATKDLVNDLYNSIINKRKFLKFVKFVTGEERSLADLMFGIKELKLDAVDNRKSGTQWKSAFKSRKRRSKMAIPYLMKEYTPNGTIIMTMNEVDYIKDTYGVDLMRNDHVKMIMDENFLLGFVILDQSNEIAYVMYDGHNYQFQEFTYNMLEREQQTSDRMMRELYRSFSR